MINLGKESVEQQEEKKSSSYLFDLAINEVNFKIVIDSVETGSILLITRIILY